MKVLVPRETYGGTEDAVVKFVARLSQFASMDPPVRFVWKIERTEDRNREYRFFLGVPTGVGDGVLRNLPDGIESFDPPEAWSKTTSRFRMAYVGLEEMLLPIASSFGKTDPLLSILRAMPKPSEIVITFSPLAKATVMTELQRLHKKLDPKLRAIERVQDEEQKSGTGAALVERAEHILGIAGRETFEFLGELTGVKEIGQLGRAGGAKQTKGSGTRNSKVPSPRLLPHEEARLKAIRARYSDAGSMFECTMQLHVPEGSSAQGDLQGLMGALIDYRDETEFTLKRHSEAFWLSASELAGLVHVPGVKQCGTQLWIRDHAFTLRDDQFNKGVAVGAYQHPIQEGRIVRIPFDQFTKHFVISGTTGAGKSCTTMYINNSIIDNWLTGWKDGKWTPREGLTFIDPAESAVLYLLARLQHELPPGHPLWNKVHYLSFSKDAHPFALNAMQFLKADEILDLLRTEYGGGANLDRLFRMGINTLLADSSVPHVLAGLHALFTIPVFRKTVLRRIDDQELETFWIDEFAEITPGMLRPVFNRLNPFTDRSSLLRPYYGQPGFSLPIREWMDDGHIVLIDAKDVKSDTATEFLLGTLVGSYHWIYQTRPAETSLLHFLEVDEAHRVKLPVMADIIKEDRKYGGCLGVISQMVNDIEPQTSVKIQEMGGTIISLQQGPKEVGAIVNMTNGHFDASYLKGLPERVATVFLRVGSGGTSLETVTPYPRLYMGYQDDREPPYRSPEMTRRMDELRQFGRELQRDIGTSRDDVEANLQYYLLNAEWPS